SRAQTSSTPASRSNRWFPNTRPSELRSTVQSSLSTREAPPVRAKARVGVLGTVRRGHRGVLGAGLDAAALAAGRPGHGNKKSEPDRGAAGPQLRLQVVESTNVLL